MHVEAPPSGIGGNGLPDNHLEEGRLSGSVGTENDDAARETHLEVDVAELVLFHARVPKVHVLHLEEFLRRRLDALKATGFRKDKFESVVVGGQLKVVLGLGLELDESAHRGLVVDQSAVGSPHGPLLVVDNVRADVFEKGRVVRDAEDRLVFQPAQEFREPVDGALRQMVGRFVQQENVGVHENGADQPQLHLPASREGPDGSPYHLVGEIEFLHLGNDHVLLLFRVLDQVLHDVLSFVFGVDVGSGIDVGRLEVLRPSLEFSVVDGVHERRLTDTVLSNNGVPASPEQPQLALPQQNLSSVREVESQIADLLVGIVVLVAVGFVVLPEDFLGNQHAKGIDLVVSHLRNACQIGPELFLPGLLGKVPDVGHARRQKGNVRQDVLVGVGVERRPVRR
mmetsp:Transcript_8494/g.25158  ORF Transcript_8494/g.25158 Transcript_8494/m.25158 type:complete len:397 (-) Transcript_8494:228-1418(-)